MRIEDFRPTKADMKLLLVAPDAASLAVSELMRSRARDEWRVPDMPAVKNRKGEEFTDRQWIENWGLGDEYAWRVILSPKGLELLAEALIRENAAQVYGLQLQVGRRELNDHDYTAFRVDRALGRAQVAGLATLPRACQGLGNRACKGRAGGQGIHLGGCDRGRDRWRRVGAGT
jgi:hypothetical protein